ncbi:transposase [Salinibacillus xinjiangensis]|uniref:transposase n=1 Tax=Salinibacillus xinjiangensis TaxID=1229268 RepID=UPI001E54B265|nr:transposase [Salinibacillus xinjiangensis]
MGRKKRIWEPDAFYHIVCRGNRRELLFYDREDFLVYLYILEKVYQQYPFEIAAYCLMSNHIHLQLRSQEIPISKIMALINKRHANYFNSKHNFTGHVYEKRFFDKVLRTPEDMIEVSRYIHLNPVEAKMVGAPEKYRWSSFRYYRNHQLRVPPYMNLEVLMDSYAMVEGEIKIDYRESLVNKGLL